MNKLIAHWFAVALGLCLGIAPSVLHGEEPSPPAPRLVPATRPQMKQMIEEIKDREPRIPLPPMTAEEEEALGERASNYEARVRYHYLGKDLLLFGSRGAATAPAPGTRPQDPEATLSYPFKVQLFWVVSRTNNCQYCIGHQETKLLAAGVPEEVIAALDCDWSSFTDAERAAFAFARKYTLQPHTFSGTEIEGLKQFYTDRQILEMCLSMSWNNAINRWKEAIGVPQNREEGGYSRMLRDYEREQKPIPEELAKLPVGSYLTETPIKFRDTPSIVAPLGGDGSSTDSAGLPRSAARVRETYAEVEQILAALPERKATLELLDPQTTRERLDLPPSTPVAHWMQLLARFPLEGVQRARGVMSLEKLTALPPLLRAQIAWIVARQDRAWYALAMARDALQDRGLTTDQIALLDGDWSEYTAEERSLFQLASSLAASPVVLHDQHVQEALAAAGPERVVQAIELVTQLAAFQRITEIAQLPAERRP